MRASNLFPILAILLIPCAVPRAAAAPPLPENSLYQLESLWKTDDGTPLQLAELRGKARVLSMFFSQCNDVCPMITGQLKTLEHGMSERLRERVGFVLVTLDPGGDSVKDLAEYRKRMGFPTDQWTLLHGSADNTRELANLLGVTYMPKQASGQIDHTGLIVILDTEGRVAGSFSGITDQKAFLALLEKSTGKGDGKVTQEE